MHLERSCMNKFSSLLCPEWCQVRKHNLLLHTWLTQLQLPLSATIGSTPVMYLLPHPSHSPWVKSLLVSCCLPEGLNASCSDPLPVLLCQWINYFQFPHICVLLLRVLHFFSCFLAKMNLLVSLNFQYLSSHFITFCFRDCFSHFSCTCWLWNPPITHLLPHTLGFCFAWWGHNHSHNLSLARAP